MTTLTWFKLDMREDAILWLKEHGYFILNLNVYGKVHIHKYGPKVAKYLVCVIYKSSHRMVVYFFTLNGV